MSKIRKAQTKQLVPYDGADQAIDLGSQNLTTTGTITATTLVGAGSGGGSWGSITGTLSNQTDLQSALDLKAAITDIAELSQDAVGTILTDSSSIDFTYTDATPAITAVVKPASITNAMLAGSITASNIITTGITTVGTLTAGSLGAGFTTVPVARGGTGGTTFTFNRLLTGNGTGAFGTVALGTANQLLGMDNSAFSNEYKTLAVGTSGTDFAIAHTANTVTFNLPSASASNRGAVTTGAQTFAGAKTFSTTPISSGGTPSGATDLVIKSYVDAIANTINPALYKNACTCATTANITLSGEQTIDTFATSATRVLVKNQTISSQNGIYISDSGAWTRASDYNTAAEVVQGTSTFILDGSVNMNKLYVMNEATVTTLGTDPITFTAISALSSYNFFTGTSGTDFAVSLAGNDVTFNLPTASATNRGAVSTTDWSTFNAKAGVSGSTLANSIAKFSNTTGTVQESGISIIASGADRVINLPTTGLLTIRGTNGSVPGALTLQAGNSTSASVAGAALTLSGGGVTVTSASNLATAGDVLIQGGDMNSTSGQGHSAGTVTIKGGDLIPSAGLSYYGATITVDGGTASADGSISITSNEFYVSAQTVSMRSTQPFELYSNNGDDWRILLDGANLTNDRTYTFPDASGTFAVSASDGVALDAAGNITLTGTDVQIFTSSGTWTKPSGTPKSTHVILFGAGGGGGAGRKGAAGTVRTGGAGGGPGGLATYTFVTSILGATETVTVGVGGTGAASQSTNTTNGASGGNGTITTFGSWLRAGRGGGGGGGSTAAATGGTPGQIFPPVYAGVSGGSSSGSGANGSGTSVSGFLPTGGGAGGGVTTGNVAASGGSGGQVGVNSDGGNSGYAAVLAGGTSGAISTAGGAGTNAPTNSGIGGSGGGGGGGSITTNGGAGGAGAFPGGGGGGGGAATNSVGNSGAGGNGGDGLCIVITTY